MTSMFENARIGDKVYSLDSGWGDIVDIDMSSEYPIHVRFFLKAEDVQQFTLGGQSSTGTLIQPLFTEEVIPEVPAKTEATKTINGVEIPNITFIPKPGDYCYIPFPTNPALYLRISYATPGLSEHAVNYDLCYPDTEEGKAAAILHAKAVLKSN